MPLNTLIRGLFIDNASEHAKGSSYFKKSNVVFDCGCSLIVWLLHGRCRLLLVVVICLMFLAIAIRNEWLCFQVEIGHQPDSRIFLLKRWENGRLHIKCLLLVVEIRVVELGLLLLVLLLVVVLLVVFLLWLVPP